MVNIMVGLVGLHLQVVHPDYYALYRPTEVLAETVLKSV